MDAAEVEGSEPVSPQSPSAGLLEGKAAVLPEPPSPAEALAGRPFVELARLAAHVCRAPMAFLAAAREQRIRLVACAGLGTGELPGESPFWRRAASARDLLVVSDALADPQLAADPLVQGPAQARFLAGIRLELPEAEGCALLCVLDREPRSLAPADAEALRALARQAVLLAASRVRAGGGDAGAHALQRQVVGLRAIVSIADDLMACASLDDVYRTAVEFARAKLGVERCAIFVDEKRGDGESLWGTYGTDRYGRTTDEHAVRIAKSDIRPLLQARGADEPRWQLFEREVTEYDGRVTHILGRGWNVATAIGLPTRQSVGVFYNDDGASGAELDPVKQDIVAVFCSLLGNIVELKREAEARTRLEAQVRNAQKLESLGVLAGGMAHDFNNLLTGILGNAGLAAMQIAADSPLRRHLEQIEASAMRAAELTHQMLAYAGKGRFVGRELDLSTLLEEMAPLLQTAAPKKAALRLQLAPGLPLVEADPEQMRQVAMSLVVNAGEALADGTGEIRVRTGVVHASSEYLAGAYLNDTLSEGACVFLEVSDTGCGMDVETKARIFDPFFSTKFTGRGLGLAAVLGIIRGHRGAIRVDSRPGQGSTFCVLFPQASPPRAQAALGGEKRPECAKQTVLVVEDEESVREVARLVLEREGITVLCAPDGQSGVALFDAHADEIDLVLLDRTMPRLGGEEALREMRRIRPDVRVILCSGYGKEETAARFADAGLAGFLHKPYRPAALLEKVRAVLSQA